MCSLPTHANLHNSPRGQTQQLKPVYCPGYAIVLLLDASDINDYEEKSELDLLLSALSVIWNPSHYVCKEKYLAAFDLGLHMSDI